MHTQDQQMQTNIREDDIFYMVEGSCMGFCPQSFKMQAASSSAQIRKTSVTKENNDLAYNHKSTSPTRIRSTPMECRPKTPMQSKHKQTG